MRIAFRIGLFLVQFVAFLAITGVSAKILSHLTAKTYLHGEAPTGIFPVVAVRLPDANSPAAQYQLLRWSEIEEARRQSQPVTFRLPQDEGRFALPRQGEFEPHVSFRVLASVNGGQLVEVVWNDDDYEVFGSYFTDGNSLQPRYLRIWGAGSVLAGSIVGLIGAWFVGWGARRKWPRSPDVAGAARG